MSPTTTSRDAGSTVETAAAGPSRLFTGTLLASSTLTIMAAAVISPSLPQMSQVFSAAPAADVLVRLTLTITSLAIGITAPLAGVLVDRVGRKPVLVSALVLYAVAGVAGFFTSHLYVLLGTRALLGVAVGGIMTAVTALITDLFTGPRRGAFLGLQAMFASLGGVVFLPLAGVLAGVAWNAPFWIYAASMLVVPFAILGVEEVRSPATPIRTAITAVTENGRWTGGGGLITVIYAVALVGTLVFFMAPTQLPFFLQRFDVSSTVVGIVVAASTASSAAAAIGYTRVRRVLSQETVTALSLASLGAGWVCIGTSASLVQVVLGVLVGGVGVGLIIPNLNLWLSELVPDARRGRVLGGLVSAIFLGQFLSPVAIQPVVSVLGLGGAFLAAGLVAVVGAAILAVTLRRRTSITTKRTEP